MRSTISLNFKYLSMKINYENEFSIRENGIMNPFQCYFLCQILEIQGNWISHSLC